jgi:transposase
MKFLGLIPSEYSTGDHRRQGAMTKAGNTQARRALIEGAWAYRYPAKVRRHLQLRLEKQPKVIQDISWKAQVRLCRRYRRLGAHGKHANVVTVAIARGLAGFMWAIAKQVPVTPEGPRSQRYCTSHAEGFRHHLVGYTTWRGACPKKNACSTGRERRRWHKKQTHPG